MSRETTWAKVKKGDALELGGKVWIVQKAKAKGKRVKVTVARNGQTASSEVKAKASVTLANVATTARRATATPLHRNGQQQRWARKSETVEAQDAREVLGTGNPKVTTPPAKKLGTPWETPTDRLERKLDSLLEAKLIAATDDVEAGYYVPPVDVSTVAAHLVMFHAKDHEQALEWRAFGVDDMLEVHRNHHEAALNGMPLPINHWHTETRPAPPA